MTSIRRIATVTVTALLTGISVVAGASSAFAQVPPDGRSRTGSGGPTTTVTTTGGGTSMITYLLIAVAAIVVVALVVVTARTMQAHTRRSHVLRHA